MEDKIVIKLKDKTILFKIKKIRQAGINITELICGWIRDYEIPNKN